MIRLVALFAFLNIARALAQEDAAKAAATLPNIIIFLAHDLGCKDIPTPNIDSIAKNGVRFTNGYATHSRRVSAN
jgi:hypothetical protein